MRSRDRRSGFASGLAALTLAIVLGGRAAADESNAAPAVAAPADGALDTYPSAGPTEPSPFDPPHRQARRPRARHLARPQAAGPAPLVILPPGSAEPTGSLGAEPADSSPAEATGSLPLEPRPKAAVKAATKPPDRRINPKETSWTAATPKHPMIAPGSAPPGPPLPPRVVRPALVKPAKLPAPAPAPAPLPVLASPPPAPAQSIASIPASNPVRARADPRPPDPAPPAPAAPPPRARPDSDEALTQIAPVALGPASGDAPDAAHDLAPASAAESGQAPSPAATGASADQALANDSRRQVLGELRKEQSRYAEEALRQLREEKQEGF